MYQISQIKTKQSITDKFIKKHFNIIAERGVITEWKHVQQLKIPQKALTLSEFEQFLRTHLKGPAHNRFRIMNHYYDKVIIVEERPVPRKEREFETIHRLRAQICKEFDASKLKEERRLQFLKLKQEFEPDASED